MGGTGLEPVAPVSDTVGHDEPGRLEGPPLRGIHWSAVDASGHGGHATESPVWTKRGRDTSPTAILSPELERVIVTGGADPLGGAPRGCSDSRRASTPEAS